MATFSRIGIVEFKELVKASKLDVIKNPKTDKLFVSASNGKNYKCQSDLDVTKPVHFLVQDGLLDEACLINQDRGQSAAPLLSM